MSVFLYKAYTGKNMVGMTIAFVRAWWHIHLCACRKQNEDTLLIDKEKKDQDFVKYASQIN